MAVGLVNECTLYVGYPFLTLALKANSLQHRISLAFFINVSWVANFGCLWSKILTLSDEYFGGTPSLDWASMDHPILFLLEILAVEIRFEAQWNLWWGQSVRLWAL